MRKTLLFTAMAATALASGAASAADFPAYVAVKMGASFEQLDDIENTTNVANRAAVNSTSQDDTSALFAGAVGVNFKNWGAPVRAEVEYAYRTDINYDPNPTFRNAGVPTRSENEISSQTVMLNAFYDIQTGSKFTPFVGAGIGFAVNKAKTKGVVLATGASQSYEQTETDFAWTVGGGVNYAITTNWSAELAYRYIDLGQVSMGDAGTAELTGDLASHELTVGVRYQF